METCTLHELNSRVRQAIEAELSELFWVTAEISELNIAASGHCFMELTEKDEAARIIAKARATIWAYQYRMLGPYFKSMTGYELAKGQQVKFQVSVTFHEVYGFSLQVSDIDPAFTVGDTALQKERIIRRLTEEGIIDMNRELEIPALTRRIAVISSETAAGYGDFIDQLHENPYGYAFQHTLFAAVVQGYEAEASIICALERIFEQSDNFDAVVLIRGGGSQSDLSCFNGYELASCIAQFPLPVITGIGHDRDETIADRVACVPLKTPTAVAEYLIAHAADTASLLDELTERLIKAVNTSLSGAREALQESSHRIALAMRENIHRHDKKIQEYRMALFHRSSLYLVQQRGRMEQTEEKLRLLDPARLLERGYSFTLAEGKIVRSISQLHEGQTIETVLIDGRAISRVSELRA